MKTADRYGDDIVQHYFVDLQINNIKNSVAMKNIIPYLTIMLLVGCSVGNETEWPSLMVMSDDIKDTAVELYAEQMPLSENLYRAKDFEVFRDSILILTNVASVADKIPFVEIYNLNDLSEHIAGYFRKGNGPDEMLNVHTNIQGSKLNIYDFVKNKYACVNLDSALNVVEYVPGKVMDMPVGSMTPFVTAFGEDSLLLWNPYSFYAKDSGIGNENVPRITILKKGDNVKNVFGEHKYFTYKRWYIGRCKA